MAEEIAGRLFIELLPDVDKKKFQAAIDKSVKGTSAAVPAKLKLTKNAVSDVVAEAQTKLSARKSIPVLSVGLRLDNSSVTEVVATTQARLAARKKPILMIDVKANMKGVRGINIVQQAEKQEESVSDIVKKASARRIAQITADYKKIEEVGALHRKKTMEGIIAQYQQIEVVEQLAVSKRIANIRADHAMIEQLSELHAMKLAGKITTEYELKEKIAEIKQRNEIAKINAHHAMKDQLAEINAARQASILKMQYENLELITAIGEADLTMKILTQHKLREQIAETSAAKRAAAIAAEAQNAPALATRSQALQEGRLNALMAAGLDQRSLMEARFQNQRALLHERGDTRVRKSSRETLRILRNDLSQFDSSTTRFVRRSTFLFAGFTAAVSASFAGISTAAIVQFGKIEQAANKAASLFTAQRLGGTKATGKAFANQLLSTNREITQQITDQSRLVAVATKFDTQQIAEGFRFLAGAGVDLGSSLKSIDTVARLAQAGFMELEDTSDLVVQGFIAAGGDINKFGDEVGALSDKLVFVANESAVTLEEVLKAFSNRAGASFVAVGQSADEALNVIRLFGQTGIKGLKAGEQSAILIREITRSATIKAPEGWKKYGIELTNADGSARSFAKVLDELTRVAAKQTKGFKDPAALVKLLNQELKLTEKSSGGLRQLLPSIAQLQKRGMGAADALAKLQTTSSGRLSAQTKAVTDTLAFQFEALTNNISNIASEFAERGGKSITEFLKSINGEAGTSATLFQRLESRAQGLGKSFSNFIGKALKGLSGPEGKRFFNGIIDGFRSTLRGVVGLFTAFRTEVFGAQSRVGFFAVAGDAFAALGRFAERTLPRIGKTLGVVVSYIRDNKNTVTAFVRAWLGLYLASKSLRLFILPLVAVGSNIQSLFKWTKAFIGLNFVQNIASAIPILSSYTKQLSGAAAAARALAAAQVAASSAGAVSGVSAARGGAGIGLAAATPKTKIQKAGKLAGSAFLAGMMLPFKSPKVFFGGILKALGSFKDFGGAIGKIIPNIGKLAKLAGPFALIGIAIDAAVGAIKGFFDEITRGSSGSSDFSNTLKELRPIIDFVVKSIKIFGKIALDVIGVFFKLGAAVGKFVAGAIRQAVINFGDLIRFFREISKGNFGTAFKALGDALLNTLIAPFKLLFAFIIDGLAAILSAGSSIPKVGKYFKSWSSSLEETGRKIRDWNIDLASASSAAKKTKTETDKLGLSTRQAGVYAQFMATQQAVAGRVASLASVASRVAAERAAAAQRRSVVFIDKAKNANTGLLNALGAFKPKFAEFEQSSRDAFNGAISASTSMTASLLAQQATLQASLGQTANYYNSVISSGLQEQLSRAQAGEGPFSVGQVRRMIAGQKEFERQQKLISGAKRAMKDAQVVQEALGNTFASTGAVAADAAKETASATKEVKTAAEQAAEAVNKLSQVQLDKQAAALVGKVTRSAAKGYQATAIEAEILRRTLPAVEAELQRQQDAVAKLDDALQKLQSTQIKGTKAFSDQAFAVEQGIKKLQLQRLDLIIAGTPEEDSAIKALDDQINKLQQSSERLSLVESLKLDPLRRKLEETFNPVKELAFGDIIKQFDAIQKQRAPLADAIAGGENLKATLESTIKDAEVRFGDAGRQVTAGFAIGIKGATPQVTQAGKTAGNAALLGVNNVMKFGSPSRTMIQRGLWVSEGFVQGINAGSSMITSAGVTAMFSFLTGMRNVYENRIQPFIKSIAAWIKENKGPVSYDATLLRPAGEAMMQGFHRGLRDGFNEVKTWVSDVGPDLARHTIPDKIFKKMSAEFLISNASADMAFDPGEFFASITPMGEVGVGANFLGQSLGLNETIKQAQMIARMFGITPNIASERRRFGNPGYNAAIGGAANSLHIAGRAMDFTGSDAGLTNAANWARKYMDLVFDEVLWKTTGHYDHLHLGWKYGDKKLIADIAGASRVVEEALANAANLTKVDFNLLAAIAKAESGFNPNSVSSAGAGGLMQLMPGTARSLGVTSLFDPKQNALGGAKYIKNMLEMFNGNIRIALAGYNAGPGNAMIAMRSFGETIAYIERVMRYFNQFKSGNYRAQGGKVNALTPYVVGERGQELFIPAQNGSVISNKDMRDLISALNGTQPGSAAGTTINDNRRFEVISNSTDPATVAALVDARMRSQIVGVRR